MDNFPISGQLVLEKTVKYFLKKEILIRKTRNIGYLEDMYEANEKILKII